MALEPRDQVVGAFIIDRIAHRQPLVVAAQRVGAILVEVVRRLLQQNAATGEIPARAFGLQQAALSRSGSMALEPRVRPNWSPISTANRLMAYIRPDWKFGM